MKKLIPIIIVLLVVIVGVCVSFMSRQSDETAMETPPLESSTPAAPTLDATLTEPEKTSPPPNLKRSPRKSLLNR